jgi:Flp pilus assembly protein CpaB
MKGGSKLFIIAGVGLGLVAVLLIIASLGGGGGTGAQSSSKGKKITVVQAVNDVPAHTILVPEDLVEKEVSSDLVPADAVRSIAEVVGKSYRAPLTSTQTLVSSQVEQPGLRNDVAVGKRAIAIPADAKNLFAGLIQDGDYIDVIFHARVNEVRVLPTNLAETPEDEIYYNFGKQKGGTQNEDNSDQEQQNNGDSLAQSSQGTIAWVPPGLEIPDHPATGDAGSKLFIRDDIAEQQQLEPVAKVMVQDARVLRVVRPGETYGPAGSIDESTDEVAGATGQQPSGGFIIVEVSLDQAEVLSFMQDKRHEFQIVVRAQNDHEHVDTNGVTFEILYQDGKYDLPLPGSVTVSSKKK